MEKNFDFAIIGAGPSGVLAIAQILTKSSSKKLLWIDPEFNLGKFGTSFAEYDGIPGNTTKQSYSIVLDEILLSNNHIKIENKTFDSLANDCTPSLKIAAEPFKLLSDYLIQDVTCVHDYVNNIDFNQSNNNYIISTNYIKYTAQCVILATGSKPKIFDLKVDTHIIPAETAFIQEKLSLYLTQNNIGKKISVIGSSHSAALATMNLLNLDKEVLQFMNKPHVFSYKDYDNQGKLVTYFDNTGLKGNVAKFTKTILKNRPKNWQWHIINDNNSKKMHDLIYKTDALVIAIGYARSNSLKLNNIPITDYQYNLQTGAIINQDGIEFEGLFGVGIAFPEQVISPSDNYEFAVGIEKFWQTIKKQSIFWLTCKE